MYTETQKDTDGKTWKGFPRSEEILDEYGSSAVHAWLKPICWQNYAAYYESLTSQLKQYFITYSQTVHMSLCGHVN